MGDVNTNSGISEQRLEATIIRCVCGDPASHAGAVCPRGKAVSLGTVAYYSSNPLKRAMWRVYQPIKDLLTKRARQA